MYGRKEGVLFHRRKGIGDERDSEVEAESSSSGPGYEGMEQCGDGKGKKRILQKKWIINERILGHMSARRSKPSSTRPSEEERVVTASNSRPRT